MPDLTSKQPRWVRRLIQIRKKNALSVEEMADRLKVSPERIRAYEAGKVTREPKALMLAAEQLDASLNPDKKERKAAQARTILGEWMKALSCADPQLLDDALGANGRIEQAWDGIYDPTTDQIVMWGLRVKAITKLMKAAQKGELATAHDRPVNLQ